jgi:ribonuclease E
MSGGGPAGSAGPTGSGGSTGLAGSAGSARRVGFTAPTAAAPPAGPEASGGLAENGGPAGSARTAGSARSPGRARSAATAASAEADGSARQAGSVAENGTEASILRRSRRAVTRPAGPPADDATPAEQAPSAATGRARTSRAGASRAGGSEAGGSGEGNGADSSGGTSASGEGVSEASASLTGASRTGTSRTGTSRTGTSRASAGRGSGPGGTRTAARAQAEAGQDSGSQDGGSQNGGDQDAPVGGDGDRDSAGRGGGGQDAGARTAGGRGATRSRTGRRASGQSGQAGQADAPDAADTAQPTASGTASATSASQPAFQPPLVIFQAPDITAVRVAAERPQRQQPVTTGPAVGDDDGDDGSDGGQPSAGRRRRRGGRGRGKAQGSGAEAAEAAGGPGGAPGEADQDDQDEAAEQDQDTSTSAGKRRRRRRRSGTAAEGEAAPAGTDDPPNTVTHIRAPRDKAADTDVRAVKGSTRLEAKRQRRREGRESGRRRPPIITESEFLARREAVERVMVVRQHDDRTQIAVLEDGVLVEHYVDKASHQSYVGNVYLGKVQNVLPSMEAAFVDIGKGRNAVLYAGEVNFDASGLEGESKRIESALKSGQSIVVQVTKDPIGHKGARLTSQVSLPGRYLVYVPGASMTGISRKLPDTERSRLKQILKQVMPENAGVIVRTAAEGASEEELSRDVARLAAQWEAIERRAKTANAPDLLYSEPDLTLRVIRDIFNEDFSSLVVASDSEWDLVDEYVRYVAPHLADRMQKWDDDKDVFAAYRIDEQLAKALERKVWLPSGGSLVIDNTEAMTVIDVNTGKFTGQGGNLEQTVTRNNLEAAEEIVRQLRLRDVGGIIVIDFIDMVLESNRELVLRRLLECLARDRTKHQVAEVTSLGLVQMTRKRVGSGLLEAFSVACEHCNGRGVITSLEPVDHSHSRKDDNQARNVVGRDSGSSDGAGGRSRGRDRSRAGAGRKDGGSTEPAEPARNGAAAVAAEVAAASKSRGSRSRATRPTGPADQIEPGESGQPQSGLSPDGQAAGSGSAQAVSADAAAGDGAAAGPTARSRSARGRRSVQAPAGAGTDAAAEPAGSGEPSGGSPEAQSASN